MKEWERRTNRLLSHQHHVIGMSQAMACGASKGSVDARVRSGAWERVASGVYRPGGADGGWEQALWIAHLAAGPGSVVSHESAAQLHGLAAVRRDAVSLTVSAEGRPQVPRAHITRSADLRPTHCVAVRGLPVTTPARTIVDLAGRRDVTVARLDAIVVAAERERKARMLQAVEVAYELRRPGRRGIGKLDEVLRAYSPKAPIPGSQLEVRLRSAIRLAGLGAEAVGQHPLPSGPLVGLVDVAFPGPR